MSEQIEPAVPMIPLREALVCASCDTLYSVTGKECPRCSSRHAFPLQRIIKPIYEDREEYLGTLAARAEERES